MSIFLAYDGNNAFLDAAAMTPPSPVRLHRQPVRHSERRGQPWRCQRAGRPGRGAAGCGKRGAAFDLLSGEIHASAAGVLTGSSHFVRDAAVNRVRAAFDEVAAAPLPMLAYAGEGAAQALPDPERLAFWAQGLGSSGHFDGDGNAARAERSIGGVFVGGDGFVNDSIRIGLLTGYSHSSFDVDVRPLSRLGGQLPCRPVWRRPAGRIRRPLRRRLQLAHGRGSRIAAFPGFSEQLSADDDGSTGRLFGELGYRVTVGEAKLEPFANLAYVSTSLDDFSETGGWRR